MKHSTGPMTAAERAYVDACKGTFTCIACLLWEEMGLAPAMYTGLCGPVEFNHIKAGNVRVGHLWGYTLGKWHHQGRVLDHLTHKQMRDNFGPSLMDGSHRFHALYGDDAALLARQDALLREWGVHPPVRPENRRWAA